MTLLILDGIGLVGIVWGCVAARNVFRHRGLITLSNRIRAYPLIVATGVLLACGSIFISYPYNEVTRIYGFPFVSAIFEFHGGKWEDFVGPTTGAAVIGNIAFFRGGTVCVHFVRPAFLVPVVLCACSVVRSALRVPTELST